MILESKAYSPNRNQHCSINVNNNTPRQVSTKKISRAMTKELGYLVSEFFAMTRQPKMENPCTKP